MSSDLKQPGICIFYAVFCFSWQTKNYVGDTHIPSSTVKLFFSSRPEHWNNRQKELALGNIGVEEAANHSL